MGAPITAPTGSPIALAWAGLFFFGLCSKQICLAKSGDQQVVADGTLEPAQIRTMKTIFDNGRFSWVTRLALAEGGLRKARLRSRNTKIVEHL
jgi:hypothetical protein